MLVHEYIYPAWGWTAPQAKNLYVLYLPCMRVNLRRRWNCYARPWIHLPCMGVNCAAGKKNMRIVSTLYAGKPTPQVKLLCSSMNTSTLHGGELRRRRKIYAYYIYPVCGWNVYAAYIYSCCEWSCDAGKSFVLFISTLYAWIHLPCMWVYCAAGEKFMHIISTLYAGEPAPQARFLFVSKRFDNTIHTFVSNSYPCIPLHTNMIFLIHVCT
jgi:hypothetical protein